MRTRKNALNLHIHFLELFLADFERKSKSASNQMFPHEDRLDVCFIFYKIVKKICEKKIP